MFEGVVAAVLNRFLGKYVQDLDTENLNVGIFSGDVRLHDLRIRPEALYELDLPIEVKAGTIGTVSLNIPWSGLYTQSVVLTIENVYVLVGPVIQGPFDAAREKRLLRAAKTRRLQTLESCDWLGSGLPDSGTFIENLITTVMNNLQVFVRNVHIRYEDCCVSPRADCVLTTGICVTSVSIEFTNNRWKPCASSPGATSVYQLIRIEAFAVYWNIGGKPIIGEQDPEHVPFCEWRERMERGLKTFNTGDDPFRFLIKPVTAKVKVIVNRSNEARVPKLLVDFVVEDISTALHRSQFHSMLALAECLERARTSRRFRQFHPGVRVKRAPALWWQYAVEAALEQRVRPYTWGRILAHRKVYAQYRDTYRRALLAPADTELRVDLQQLEDQLDVVNIAIAREHAKVQLFQEDPDRVALAKRSPSWWERLTNPTRQATGAEASPGSDCSRSPSPELRVKTERPRGLWTQLSSGERDRLYEAIGYAEGALRPEKPKQYIEHKLNVTVVNWGVSLWMCHREVWNALLTQTLASLETRPAASAYKLSIRTESITMEGYGGEHEGLVPVFNANVNSGNSYSNFIAIDFEKNPMKMDADFGLSITMEPMEILYHQRAASELLSFLCRQPKTHAELWERASAWTYRMLNLGKKMGRRALCRRTTYCVNMDIRGPYIVIPESGSMQKGGQVLVLDMGRVVVRSELQPVGGSLEDATQMELEERLYDRLHIECSETQVLFCDSGDEWRESRKMQDSELHLVPKIRGQVVFSNSVKPEYRQLARHKLTVSFSSLKLNLSDRRIGLALDFIENVQAPVVYLIPAKRADGTVPKDPSQCCCRVIPPTILYPTDRVPGELEDHQLAEIRRIVTKAAVVKLHEHSQRNKEYVKMAALDVDRSIMSSDQSDSEELELWARTVDLPGFDDNVSPHNAITMLLRFVIGEIVINLARSSNRVDKPYLLLRVGKLCCDSALMEYGPAVQASVGSIQLVDRLHPGSSGQYLEMISTAGGPTEEVLTLLYRKVRSNCPDFKSHFHSVEQSLVVDVATVHLVFHQEAFITLHKYLQYIVHKILSREAILDPLMDLLDFEAVGTMLSALWSSAGDPPIPQGATKFSYSTRLGEVHLKLCDTELDFLDMKVCGLESDCLFKANERMVLRLYLTSMQCDDVSDATLYHKVLQVDDDKVLDLKYVRHSPRFYKQTDMESHNDDVKSDGNFKLKLGRIRVVMLYKMMVDLQHFLEPLLRPGVLPYWLAIAGRHLQRYAGQLRSCPIRLHLSLQLHLPSVLLPQKSASPNLVVFNLGDLTVENFFKELSGPGVDGTQHHPVVMDNILVRLENVLVCRAVMTLAGALHIQEPILEPLSLRLDVKRWVAPWGATRPSPCGATRDMLLYDVSGGMDLVKANLGQRDLAIILSVWTDNLEEGRFIDISESHPASPVEHVVLSPSHAVEDHAVRKLQAFFCQNEQVRKESSVRLTFDGVQIALFNDMDEILSSPMRDMSHGVCRLELGEASLSIETHSDRSLELKTSLLTCVLEDIRPDHPLALKKIFQSHAGSTHTDSSAISVSTPPILDLTFRQSQAGDRCIDILVEQTRLNLSVGFLASVARFLMDALPGDLCLDGGFINQGYVGDLNVNHKTPPDGLKPNQRPPSSADSTSGYYSSRASCAEEQAGLSIGLQLRKPEILLLADPPEQQGLHDQAHLGVGVGSCLSPLSNSLLLRTELLLDYSRHPGRESLVCSLSGLQVHALPSGALRNEAPQQVLYPCDIEFSRSFKSAEEGVQLTGSVSPVDIRLRAGTVNTILDVAEDVRAALQPDEYEQAACIAAHNYVYSEAEDLWSPKKTQPYIFPDQCDGLGLGFMYTARSCYSPGRLTAESLTLSMPKVRVVLELEGCSGQDPQPVLLLRAAADARVQDWSTQMHLKGDVQLQVSFFNGEVGAWEPLIEPVVEEENVYRPWELQVKSFRAKSFPICSRLDSPYAPEYGGGGGAAARGSGSRSGGHSKRNSGNGPGNSSSVSGSGAGAAASNGNKRADDSQTSGDETDPEHSMTFIRRPGSDSGLNTRGIRESVSMIGYPDDSDSENEEGVMEKLASAMGHLFTGDSSDDEGEASESDDSSIAEPSGATEEASELDTMSAGGSTVVCSQERAVFLKKHSDSVDSGLEAEPAERQATYVLFHAKDRLELTVSTAALHVLTELYNSFFCDDVSNVHSRGPSLSLQNKLGPGSTAILTSKSEKGPDGKNKVLLTAAFDSPPSTPSSPGAGGEVADEAGVIPDAEPSGMPNEDFAGAYAQVYENTAPGQEMFSPTMTFPQESITSLYNKITDNRLTVMIEGFDPIQVLCPQRSAHKLHALLPAKHNTRYHVMVDVQASQQSRRVTVRSPLQIRNETVYTMGLYYKKAVLEGLQVMQCGESTNPFEDTIRFAVIEPDHTFCVPLHIAYLCKLYVLPAHVDSYHISEAGLWWKELAADLNSPRDIHCPAKDEKDATVLAMRAVCSEGAPVKQSSRTIPNYLLRLLPPLVFHNRLPYAVDIKIPAIKYEVRIEAGEKASVYFLNMLKVHKIVVEVSKYLGLVWTGSFTLTSDLEEKTIAMTTEQDTEGGNKQLGLSLRLERHSACDVYLHAPYWIINKTGLPLQIRGSLSDVVYEAVGEEPLLFCYRKHRRRCVRLRAYHSSWTSAFSLDTAGSAGLVVCKDRERNRHYRILMSVTLSRVCPQLTKIVTLLPNFIVCNDSKKPLRFMEENERADLWIDLAPGQCVAYWPVTDSMKMLVKYRDSKVVSQHFPITQTHRTVLRMDKGTGLTVEVSGGADQPFSICFRGYGIGDAPVRVDNLCEDLFLKIHQQDLGQVALLSPFQSVLYTWDDPTRERSLLWNVYNKKCKGFVADFWKDGYGQERVCFHSVRQPSGAGLGALPSVTAKLSAGLKLLSPRTVSQDGSSSSDDTESDDLLRSQQRLKRTRRDKVVVYWVSFLEAHQRVLLFTQDERIAMQARRRVHSERTHWELFLSLSGIGVSLVDSPPRPPPSAPHGSYVKEIAYLSLSDSAALWEVSVAHRWKPITLELASWIEDRWRQDHKKAMMRDFVHVDFEKMHMTKPFYGELRRRYSPALWLQVRRSEHHTYVRMSAHRLQVDNQMANAHFPTVLSPAPIPTSVARRGAVKPCIDLLVLKRHRPAFDQDVYKYVKCLVQEFCVQLDRDFLDTLCTVWDSRVRIVRYARVLGREDSNKPAQGLRNDLNVVHLSLHSIASKARLDDEIRSVVEYVHLGPLRLRVSIFPGSTARPDSERGTGLCAGNGLNVLFGGEMLEFVLNGLAPSLTEIKNMRLKMSYFERKGILTTSRDLIMDALWHYYLQMIQQVHVLVLGQDVLGNPYGYVSDFTDGFGEFFYEPYLGTMDSPDEYAEGMSLGAQALLGHVTGAGGSALAMLGPSLGAILPSLSSDEDYKKKRRLYLLQTSDLPELTRTASRTFAVGVLLGLSGVVLKPTLGVPQEGVEGFFRGTGKGLYGLMTKPSGGVIDCVAMAHDGIKRALELGEDITIRARLPRFLSPYLGVRPFSVYQATGQLLLHSLSRGHYVDSDLYWAHAALTRDGKSMLLVTLQHVFLLERCRQWGPCDVEWSVRVDDIMEVPKLESGKLNFQVRQDESFSAFSGDGRSVTSEDVTVLAWLRDKVEAALVLNMEDKPVPTSV